MASLSTQSERKQLEEDIERIKSALRSSEGEWQFSLAPGIGESESEDDGDGEDSLQIVSSECEPGTSHSSQTAATSRVIDKKPISAKKKGVKRTAAVESEDVSVSVGDTVGETSLEDTSQTSIELIHMSIALNKAYQEIIVENLETIRLMLAQNKEGQDDVHNKLAEDMANRGVRASKNKKRNPANYGYPYFRDKNGLPPPMNYEARCRQAADEPDAFQRPAKSWTHKEKKILQKAMEADLLKQTLQPIMNRKELDLEKLNDARDKADKEAEAVIRERLEKHEEAISDIMEHSSELRNNTNNDAEKVDWLKISAIDFNGYRRPDECYIYWRNHLHPKINTARWTPNEDEKLTLEVKNNGGRNWENIATALGTNRSAFQCLQRFQTRLNPCLQTGKWSTEEDNFLKEVISSFNVNETIPWDQVAYYMEGRSNEQCEQRWEYLQSVGKMGRWTEEEDKLLTRAVERYGKEWVKVQELVPNRLAKQCRERYMNTLRRSTKSGFWRYHEDKTLWLMCQELGEAKWSQICAEIPGRNDNSCLQRHRVLTRLKHIEDIILRAPNGKTMVERLLARSPMQKDASVTYQQAKESKIKKLTNQIAQAEKTSGRLQQDLDLMTSNSRLEKYYIKKLNKTKDHKLQLEVSLEQTMNSKPCNMWESIKPGEIQHDMEQCAKDRAAGVYVPRPLFGIRGLKSVLFNLEGQLKLRDIIQRKAKNILGNLPLGEGNIKLTNIKMEAMPPLPKIMKTKGAEKYKTGRRRRTDVEDKVEQDIMDLLHIGKAPAAAPLCVGRPRNKVSENMDDAHNKERGLDMEHKVFKILVSALNVDIEGATKHSKKLIEENIFDPHDSKSRKLQADLELFQTALNRNLGTPQHVKPGSQSTATLPDVCLQMLPRRALQGPNASKAYKLPPLPPTVSTLKAFKSLLLKRRRLIELSSKRQLIRTQRHAENKNENGLKPKRRRLSNSKAQVVFPGMEDSESQQSNMADAHTGRTKNQFISRMKQMASVASVGEECSPNHEDLVENENNSEQVLKVKMAGAHASHVCSVIDEQRSASTQPDVQNPTSNPGEPVNSESTPAGIEPTPADSEPTTADSEPTPADSKPTLTDTQPAIADFNRDKQFKAIDASSDPTSESTSVLNADAGLNQPTSEISAVNVPLAKPRMHAGTDNEAQPTFLSSPAFKTPIAPRTPLRSPDVQPRVMVVRGSDMNPAELAQFLKSKGVIVDPQKVTMQLLNKTDIAKRVIKNSNIVSMGGKMQTKNKRKKALEILRKTHDYQLLKSRFKSLFLWPALLSTIPVEPLNEGQQCATEQSEEEIDSDAQVQLNESSVHPVNLEPMNRDKMIKQPQHEQYQKGCVQPGEQQREDVQLEEQQEPITSQHVYNPEGGAISQVDILAPSARKDKRTKKHLTRRNRYPCSGGKRFRKATMMRHELKEKHLENYRSGKLKSKQSAIAQSGSNDISKSPWENDDLSEHKQEQVSTESDQNSHKLEVDPGGTSVSKNTNTEQEQPSIIVEVSEAVSVQDITTNTNVSQTKKHENTGPTIIDLSTFGFDKNVSVVGRKTLSTKTHGGRVVDCSRFKYETSQDSNGRDLTSIIVPIELKTAATSTYKILAAGEDITDTESDMIPLGMNCTPAGENVLVNHVVQQKQDTDSNMDVDLEPRSSDHLDSVPVAKFDPSSMR